MVKGRLCEFYFYDEDGMVFYVGVSWRGGSYHLSAYIKKWFVAKGNTQNTKLYSLVEFKNEKGKSIRKDAKFDKQYLEGKYGADP